MNDIKFSLSIQTPEAGVYYEQFDQSFPIPRVGEEVMVGGDAAGFWKVLSVDWMMPSREAMIPSLWVTITVEWAASNNKPAPVYDEDEGWTK